MSSACLTRALYFSGIACAAHLAMAAPARAIGLTLVGGQMLALLQSASSPNLCISYTYDRNGNVLVKTNSTFGAHASWGSSIYGCFVWAGS